MKRTNSNKDNAFMKSIDISKYDYISFDVFDTLIFRTVSKPENIFKIVQVLYCQKYEKKISNFYKKRLEAERTARAKMGEHDVTLNEIYENLEYSQETKEILKVIEIDVELNNCVPNQPMVEFAKQCTEQGKKIVITTDMYLPRTFFQKLLKKLNLEAYAIIISSEERETKRTGKLYPILLNRLGVNANNIVHIGDDPNNDLFQAQRNGICSIERWLDKPDMPFKYSMTNDLIEDHIDMLYQLFYNESNNQSAYDVGFSILGPFLYGFCTWLHEQKIKYKLTRLLFVAREGYLIEQCYKTLYPDEIDNIGYICLNKNLLRLPLLDSTNYQKQIIIYKNSLINRSTYTWSQIFDTFYLDTDDDFRRSISEKIKVNYHIVITRAELYEGVYDNALCKLFELAKDTIKQQSTYLMRYLKQEGFIDGSIGLVNNSINGNGQYMLENYLNNYGINSSIFGLQFLDSDTCKKNIGDRYSTYLDSLKLTNFQKFCFDINCLIFEHLLFEPVGTSLAFFDNMEFIDVEKMELTKEKDNFDYINEVQRYTLKFIDVYKSHVPLPCGEIGFSRLIKLFQYPDIKIAKPICNIWDEDSDGVKMLVDKSVPLRWRYKLYKDVPKSILWLQGYLMQTGVSNIWFKIIHLKLFLIYYRLHLSNIIKDFKVLYKRSFKSYVQD